MLKMRVIPCLDVKDGRVVKGVNFVDLTDAGVAAIVYTDIARDGALTGVDAAATAAFAREVGVPVIASGGVASLADIAALAAHEGEGITGAICGRALYDGRLDPKAALRLVEEAAPC